MYHIIVIPRYLYFLQRELYRYKVYCLWVSSPFLFRIIWIWEVIKQLFYKVQVTPLLWNVLSTPYLIRTWNYVSAAPIVLLLFQFEQKWAISFSSTLHDREFYMTTCVFLAWILYVRTIQYYNYFNFYAYVYVVCKLV